MADEIRLKRRIHVSWDDNVISTHKINTFVTCMLVMCSLRFFLNLSIETRNVQEVSSLQMHLHSFSCKDGVLMGSVNSEQSSPTCFIHPVTFTQSVNLCLNTLMEAL